MFDNVGSRIMLIARISVFAGTIAFIISGIVAIIYGVDDGEGWIIFGGFCGMILSFPMAYLVNLPLYALGALVENSDIIAKNIVPKHNGAASASVGSTINNVATKTNEDDVSRKKAELDRLKEQGLITEEEYRSRIEEVNGK